MPLRALLYRRPSEPRTIEIVFDRSVYLVQLRRHRQARRYTLRIQATTREVILTIPPRGTLKEAGEFAQKHGGWIAARLGRLPDAAPFADGVVVPLRGVPHRIAHRRGMRGTVWAEVTANGSCASPATPRISTAAWAITCAARPGASLKPRA
jgi:predicted metal-dependent hydrolase